MRLICSECKASNFVGSDIPDDVSIALHCRKCGAQQFAEVGEGTKTRAQELANDNARETFRRIMDYYS